MELFLEQLINGCAIGSYAMFRLGFGIVFATPAS
jgi:hypothetical protein